MLRMILCESRGVVKWEIGKGTKNMKKLMDMFKNWVSRELNKFFKYVERELKKMWK